MAKAPIDLFLDQQAEWGLEATEPPDGLQPGERWAIRSGTVKIADVTLRCHVLNDGTRIFDAEDVEKFFAPFLGEGNDAKT